MLQLKTTSKLQKISMNVNLNLNFLFLFKNALSHSLSITHIFHSKNFFIWSFSKYPSLIKNRRNRTTTKTIPFPTPQPLTLSIFSSLSLSIHLSTQASHHIPNNIYIYISYTATATAASNVFTKTLFYHAMERLLRTTHTHCVCHDRLVWAENESFFS